METVKQQAKEVIDKLPEQASWDDVMYEIYVRAIEGLLKSHRREAN